MDRRWWRLDYSDWETPRERLLRGLLHALQLEPRHPPGRLVGRLEDDRRLVLYLQSDEITTVKHHKLRKSGPKIPRKTNIALQDDPVEGVSCRQDGRLSLVLHLGERRLVDGRLLEDTD